MLIESNASVNFNSHAITIGNISSNSRTNIIELARKH